jgi:phosphatidylglycerol:prolipoprotein diacylglycerol transferase
MSLLVQPAFYWALAVVAILAAASRAAQRACLDAWTMYLAGLAGLGGALLGSWAYVSWFGLAGEAEGGGRAAVGAFLGAAACGGLAIRLRGGDFLRYADAAVPAVALGYAVYRVGCFVNGCCFGTPTDLPWGVAAAPGSEAYAAQLAGGGLAGEAAQHLHLHLHPTQLYHAAAGLLIFVLLTRTAPLWPGRRLAFAMLAYGLARFVIEFYRGNARPIWLGLDVNHLFCMAMVALAAALWWRHSAQARRMRARVRWA